MPAALVGQSKPEAKEDLKVKTAFMILITENGDFVLENNINAPVIPDRPATPLDIEQAVKAMADEFKSQRIAAAVVNMQMQLARQAQEAANNQAVLQQMGKMPR
jgi:hypothetical protein